MSLQYALLGLIRYQPSTGYQLKDNFDQSINFLWRATLPQIYRTLNHLEAHGWLRVEVETQVGKPNRKIYYITDDGEAAFINWLNSPFEPIELKFSTLIKIFFANKGDPEKVAHNLQKMLSYYQELNRTYAVDCADIIEKEIKEPRAGAEGVYWEMARDFGERWTKMMVEWCEESIRIHGKKL